MRATLMCCVIALGCGGSSARMVTDLDTRVAKLEAVPPPTDPHAATDALSARVAELTNEITVLHAQLAELETKLDKIAMAPRPSPPTANGRLDKDRVYAVPLDDSPAIGPTLAPVTLVAAVQFPEPFTHKSWPVLQQLRAEYKKDLRIIIKSYIVHPRATDSSIAACAAAYQGQLDEIEGEIWNLAQTQGAPRQLDPVELRDLARSLRIDLTQYDRDVSGPCKAGLARDVQTFTKLGQRAVPVFWINGRPLEGAMPVEAFRAIIDEERAKAKADKAKGGKLADYYDRILKAAPPAPAP